MRSISTRGRANTLRLALSGQLGPEALRSDYVAAAMDLCVSCKGCKRDCPTGVDMARMKIEVKSARSMARGLSWRDRMIGAVPSMAPWARRLRVAVQCRPGSSRPISASPSSAACRSGAAIPFLTTTEVDDRDATVVIFADTFSNNFEPEILHAARRVLTAAGHKVAVAWPTLGAPALCCGRTYLSTGQVERARSEARRLLNALRPFAIKGVPIIGLEPSCLFTLARRVPGDESR